jgi:tRNA(Ile)-lysidine synthase
VLERLEAHLRESGLIPGGSRVLVGYSGGADSTCLLHLLHRLEVDVVAAHLHHGQRPEADREMGLCEAFCSELGVPFASGRADVPGLAAEMKIGIEEAGREARYGFFRQAAFRLGCDRIATAHTRTDLVETVLMNFARGTGLAGLAGIPRERDGIVRPLLQFSREDTRRYCEAEGLWFHDDPSNEDVSFARARLRHRVLPELRAINPAVDLAVARLARIAEEEDRFLNGAAAAALEGAEIPLNGPLRFLSLDAEAAFANDRLLALPPVLLKRALRLAAGVLGASLDAEQVETVVEGLQAGEKGAITAAGGRVALEWEAERLVLRDVQPTEPFRYPLTLPGETLSEEFGWRFVAYETEFDGRSLARASSETLLDASALKGSLFFRSAAPGDEMRPLGFSGRRKLADLLSEARLTQAARRRLPIVCDLVGPVWAPGVCLDERAAPSKEGSRAILLRFESVSQSERHGGEETPLRP